MDRVVVPFSPPQEVISFWENNDQHNLFADRAPSFDVFEEMFGARIRIRCGDVVVAEHPRAPRPGACMADPAHVTALAQRTLGRGTPPPPLATFALPDTVAQTPLAVYEAEAG